MFQFWSYFYFLISKSSHFNLIIILWRFSLIWNQDVKFDSNHRIADNRKSLVSNIKRFGRRQFLEICQKMNWRRARKTNSKRHDNVCLTVCFDDIDNCQMKSWLNFRNSLRFTLTNTDSLYLDVTCSFNRLSNKTIAFDCCLIDSFATDEKERAKCSSTSHSDAHSALHYIVYSCRRVKVFSIIHAWSMNIVNQANSEHIVSNEIVRVNQQSATWKNEHDSNRVVHFSRFLIFSK